MSHIRNLWYAGLESLEATAPKPKQPAKPKKPVPAKKPRK